MTTTTAQYRLQNGQQFEVVNMDEDRAQPIIELKPVDCEYYIRTRNKVNVLDAESEESREINGFTLHFGRGTVLVHHHSDDQFYIGNSDPRQQAIPTGTPPILMDTQLCWVEVPEDVEQFGSLDPHVQNRAIPTRLYA